MIFALPESPGNICTDSKIDGTESVRKKFGVGTDTAKTIHEVASKSLKARARDSDRLSWPRLSIFCLV